MKRRNILENTIKCVCGDREQDYGTPENKFTTIAQLWAVYLGAAHPIMKASIGELSAKDVAVLMGLLKVARIATGNKEDNFIDLSGYAACAGEIAERENVRGV